MVGYKIPLQGVTGGFRVKGKNGTCWGLGRV